MPKCTNCNYGWVYEMCTVCLGKGGFKNPDGTTVKCSNPECNYGHTRRKCQVCNGTGEVK